MKELEINLFVKDFELKKDKFAFFCFYFFKHGAKTKEECLSLNLTKCVKYYFPDTINLIISYYLKKDVDEIDVNLIEKKIENLFLTEKKSHL